MLVASTTILGLFATEILLLATIGAMRSQEIIGSVFYTLHLLIFFLGVPSLANVLVFQARLRTTFTIALCTAFAFVLVLLQYGITETLYGIE